jgi:hypothetical protein
MNASDIIYYGNTWLMGTIKDFPEGEWDTPDVCGVWSTKEIIAHLASFELMLIEVLNQFLDGGPMPLLEEIGRDHQAFNDNQVGRRAATPWKEVLDEYHKAHEEVMGLIGRIPTEVRTKAGTLPWYGMEYALDDYIVYTFYGHKREHGAQINVFRDIVG